MGMRVTLKEVAELAKVSVATASIALNGGEVKESTRTRVLECARRINYVPNRIGRTLNTGKSNTIALLMMTSVEIANIVHKTSLFYYLQQGVLGVVYQALYQCGAVRSMFSAGETLQPRDCSEGDSVPGICVGDAVG